MDSSAEPGEPTSHATSPPASDSTLDWRGKVYILLGIILSIGILKFTANSIGFPETPHVAASLLQHASPIVVIPAILITFVVCTAVGTIIAGSVREDAGLFCASVALVAVSLSGGTVRNALLEGSGTRTLLQLELESIVFVVMLSLATGAVSLFRQIRWVRNDDQTDGFAESLEAPAAVAGAVSLSLFSYLVLLFILAQTDLKAQALASCAIAGILSALLAHYVFPAKPAGCFYITPVIAGMIGYFAVYLTNPSGIETGQLHSTLAPLARALPIDHASAGVAGSLAGYWLSRRMHVVDQTDP